MRNHHRTSLSLSGIVKCLCLAISSDFTLFCYLRHSFTKTASGKNKYYYTHVLYSYKIHHHFTFYSMAPPRKPISRKHYSEDAVLLCIKSIESGRTVYAACKEFGIPMSTIIYRMSGRWKNKYNPGPVSVLSKVEEQRIVEWLNGMQNRGFPVTRSALLFKVNEVLVSNPRPTPFRNDRPGKNHSVILSPYVSWTFFA